VVALGDAARTRAVPLVAALRRASEGLAITIDYGDAKIASQFKKADRAHARAAIIIGDDEVRDGTLVVRDLVSRGQETVPALGSDALAAQSLLAWYRALPIETEVAA